MGTAGRKLSSVYRLSAIRRIHGFRTVSDELCLIVFANTDRHIGGWDEADILSPSQVFRANSSQKTKVEKRKTPMHKWNKMVTMGEHFKGRWTFHVVTLWVELLYVTPFLNGRGCFRKSMHSFELFLRKYFIRIISCTAWNMKSFLDNYINRDFRSHSCNVRCSWLRPSVANKCFEIQNLISLMKSCLLQQHNVVAIIQIT